ncbi:MAG TPA: phosphatase PAP2 family protein [Candidatus Competibacter sp.]|nr:phosphatase PAP2 family protein [Candidatus Competibacter sp.]
MIASERPRGHRWNSWHWDLPLAALAGMVAIILLRANQPLFLGINRLSMWTGDLFWADVTILGDTLIALTLCLPLVRRWPELVWTGLLAGLLAALFVHGLKHPIHLDRPALVLPHEQFHVIGRTRYDLAFPSGHTTTAFAFVGVIILNLPIDWRHRLAVPLLALAGLVGLSRIVVGAHWPLDVLGGAAGGWLAAVFGTLWARRWRWGGTPVGRSWLTLALVGCALTTLLYYKTGYPQADAWRRILALLCLGVAAYEFWMERSSRSRAEADRR